MKKLEFSNINYFIMRKYIYHRFSRTLGIASFIILPIIFNLGEVYAYDASDAVLGTNAKNIGYLRYFHLENKFESASVNYLFGEIRIINVRAKLLVPLTNRINEENAVEGIKSQGIDSFLLIKTCTNTFRFKPNSHIKFLRKLYLSELNGQNTLMNNPNQEAENDYESKYDNNWIVSKNSIKDQTEFLMEIVKVNDPSSIYVIDSVGVDENNDQVVAPRYGWKPDKINHIRRLPNEFANQDVYIRVKPIRYGRTNKSLTMRTVPHWISKSALAENEGLLNSKVASEEFTRKLLNKFFNESLLYCDSVKTTTGRLPDKLPLIEFLTLEQKEILEKMFFDVKIVNNDTIITEKNNKQIQTADIYLGEDKHNRLSVNHINCIPFDKILSLNIHCVVGLPESTIKLFDYQYALLSEIWYGDLHPGINNVSIDHLDLPRGVYLLQINSNPLKTTISAIIKR